MQGKLQQEVPPEDFPEKNVCENWVVYRFVNGGGYHFGDQTKNKMGTFARSANNIGFYLYCTENLQGE